MVYFNCGACGTGLRKNQVEQHMYSCRSKIFSCIDCNKDFKNDEYKSHVKCLTESERYESKSSYVAKANKGELKQNAWFEKVLKAIESFKGSARAKSILEKLTDYPNVPRKKAKFFNFIRNSFRSYSLSDSQLEEIWSVIESFDKTDKPTNQQQQQNLKRKLEPQEQEVQENDNLKKLKNEQAETGENELNNDGYFISFDWLELLKKECTKNKNNEISFDKLEKKLFKKYKKFKNVDKDENTSCDQTELLNKFRKKMLKKLKKSDTWFSLIKNDNDENFSMVKYILTT